MSDYIEQAKKLSAWLNTKKSKELEGLASHVGCSRATIYKARETHLYTCVMRFDFVSILLEMMRNDKAK